MKNDRILEIAVVVYFKTLSWHPSEGKTKWRQSRYEEEATGYRTWILWRRRWNLTSSWATGGALFSCLRVTGSHASFVWWFSFVAPEVPGWLRCMAAICWRRGSTASVYSDDVGSNPRLDTAQHLTLGAASELQLQLPRYFTTLY
jgi:hypothetical protein